MIISKVRHVRSSRIRNRSKEVQKRPETEIEEAARKGGLRTGRRVPPGFRTFISSCENSGACQGTISVIQAFAYLGPIILKRGKCLQLIGLRGNLDFSEILVQIGRIRTFSDWELGLPKSADE